LSPYLSDVGGATRPWHGAVRRSRSVSLHSVSLHLAMPSMLALVMPGGASARIKLADMAALAWLAFLRATARRENPAGPMQPSTIEHRPLRQQIRLYDQMASAYRL
jgi:hypothetical protein